MLPAGVVFSSYIPAGGEKIIAYLAGLFLAGWIRYPYFVCVALSI